MSLRIGDKVKVMAKVYKEGKLDLKESRKGHVVDLKWNLVLIDFPDEGFEWIDCKKVQVVK